MFHHHTHRSQANRQTIALTNLEKYMVKKLRSEEYVKKSTTKQMTHVNNRPMNRHIKRAQPRSRAGAAAELGCRVPRKTKLRTSATLVRLELSYVWNSYVWNSRTSGILPSPFVRLELVVDRACVTLGGPPPPHPRADKRCVYECIISCLTLLL